MANKRINELMDLIENNNFTVYTHAGTIHPDDLLSGSLIKCVFKEYYKLEDKSLTIRRVTDRDLQEHDINDKTALVFDIGRGRFDHHQVECPLRNIDKPTSKYAALGRLWAYIGEEVCLMFGAIDEAAASIAAKYLDDAFIQNMDRTDNFGQQEFPNTLSFLIKCYIPSTCNSKLLDETYEQLCKMIDFRPIIDFAVKHGNDIQKAKLIADATDKDYIILDQFIPAVNFSGTHIKYTLNESNRDKGCWNLNAVDTRLYPISIKQEEAEGCKFIHAGKFLAVFNSKEAAIKAAEKCLGYGYW